MDIFNAVRSRRSIRKYTGEVIDDKQVRQILEAGFSAPSAHNTRPWQFMVVKNPDNINKITEFHPYSKMLPSAGCAIIICGDRNAQPEDERLGVDCSAAMENMLIEANAMGLGAVWLGVYPTRKMIGNITDLFALPQNILPVAIMAVGHADEQKPLNDNFDESKVHYDIW